MPVLFWPREKPPGIEGHSLEQVDDCERWGVLPGGFDMQKSSSRMDDPAAGSFLFLSDKILDSADLLFHLAQLAGVHIIAAVSFREPGRFEFCQLDALISV